MKVLFVGIGSIGTRHLKNLTDIAKENNLDLTVHALRRAISPLPLETENLIDKQITSVCDDDYDIAFITNPTNLHYPILKDLKGRAKFFFIEKPIFENCDYNLEELELNEENAYIACPMRYTKSYQTLKEILKDEKAYSVRIICSSYLPDWRKNIDYRKNYSAIKAMGGGVTIDLIHETDYMTDLFGFPIESYNFKGQYSHLEIDSDDLSVYIARYKDKLIEVHLDYIGRIPKRTCEVLTKDGTITAEFNKGSVTLADGKVIDCTEDVNERFIKEMRYFINLAMKKEKNNNPPKRAYEVLALTLGEKL